MSESNEKFRFWMSGEIQSDIGNFYRESRDELEILVNNCFQTKYYGKGLLLWAYIAIILNEETDQYYPEVKRYSKRKKEVEFRLKINHKEFLEGDSKTHLRLIAKSILRSLELMKDMKIKDFNIDGLAADVTECLSEYIE